MEKEKKLKNRIIKSTGEKGISRTWGIVEMNTIKQE